MKRRVFIQHSSVIGAAVALSPGELYAQPKKPANLEKITILHTNDTHSNIETFGENHPKYPNQGGVARRFELIQQIRKAEEHVLLFDAGDIFQGTPYFNKFEGTLDMKLMSQLGYDCATLGNHDFDIGLEGFLKAKQFANFPFVNINYDFTNTALQSHIQPYQVFEKGSFKIGVFGVGIALEGLVAKTHYQDTVYLDPVPLVNQTAAHLRNELDCDLVICLSHLGHYSKQFKLCDRFLAQETSGVDLIIGGHTHTFLDEPEIHKNKKGELVLINQVGWAGLALGRIDFYLGERKRAKGYKLVLV